MKYKVGDKVRVRKDLSMDECYGLYSPISDMCELAGKVVTIVDTHGAGRNSYTVAEQISGNHWWTDEMFEGLAEEEPKFKVGDRVKAVRTEKPNKKLYIGTVYTIRKLYPNGNDCFNEPHYGVKDPDCNYIWLESELELVNETPTPTPELTPVININVTVNNYDNACWYCRKGGLVDLYLDGAMGICPNCKRVCNDVRRSCPVDIECKPSERPKSPKRKNKYLTTEELKALPSGTKVWCSSLWENKREVFDDEHCGWRVIDGDKIRMTIGGAGHYDIRFNDDDFGFRAYLEEPEQAKIPKPEVELPF